MAKHWAIAIGINAYQHFQPLSYAQQDAESLRQCWIDRGLLPEQCLLLTSMSPPIEGASTFPSLESIQYWLQWLTEVALEPGDRLWIFFGGYGVCHEDQDYWMPIEGDPRSPETTGLPLRSLYERLKASAIETLVFLDINRNEGAMAQAAGNQVAILARDCGIPTMLSCMPEQYSREAMELRHGLFTVALLEGFRQDGLLTLGGLDRFVSDRLEELCDHYWRPLQRAWTIGDLALWPGAVAQGLVLPSPVLPVLPLPAVADRSAGLDESLADAEAGGAALVAEPLSGDGPGVGAVPLGSFGPAAPIVLKSLDTGSPRTKAGRRAHGSAQVAVADRAAISRSSPWADGRALAWMGLAGAGLLILAGLRGGAPDSAVVQELSVAGQAAGAGRADSPDPVRPTPLTPKDSGTPVAFTAGASPVPRSGQAIVSFKPPVDNPSVANSSVVKSPVANSIAVNSPSANSANVNSTNSTGNPQPMAAIPPRQTSPQVEAARKLLRTNQASQFNQAIAQLRQIPPGTPGYEDARSDMNRWSRTIYDLAAGRAEQGDYQGAIAAARLVPTDLDGGDAAQDSLAQWQQQVQLQQRNSRDLARAQALIRPHQASSYNKAIAIARRIQPGEPQSFEAQRLTSQWSTEIWSIAQARSKGREWDLAIAAARLIPADSPHAKGASTAIKTWEARLGKAPTVAPLRP
jgi:hypothetical protein